MENALRTVHVAAKWVAWLAVAALALMMFLTASDVVLRYFGFPIPGTFDIVRLAALIAIAVPIAYTQSMGGHIAIEFIVEKFPRKMRFSIGILNYLLNFIAYALLSWQAVLYGMRLARTSEVSETVMIPLFPFAYVLAFALFFQAIVVLAQFAEYIMKGE